MSGILNVNSNSQLSSVIITDTSGLYTDILLNDNNLSSFDMSPITSNQDGISIDLTGNVFTSTTVDDLFNFLGTTGWLNGDIDISGQTPAAPPTAASLTARNTLTTDGWTITTD